ncbi:glycosylhydrolase-like jelly roll fold domain-containing protein [Bacillus solitudinis]|uniref:glycosylhydrolase-like jelly roll fold domain-containing protein n=1 Tax=Bacillus solitudinis TaxID=2014074 RepID=UPI000C23B1A4|nr:glycosylhydrolase-like jelly roll fold domain-containing protein [Bacillus solitudinis]
MPTLEEQFLHPADEFSPIPFWFWNDTLSHNEIKKQIYDFSEKGVMGFVLHPRIGIPKEIEYLSDLFFDFVKTAVAEANKLGMTVILYDEAMYPSGSAKGMVVKDYPEYASKGLKMVEYPCEKTTTISLNLEEGERLVSAQAVEKISSHQINRQSTKHLDVTNGTLQFTPPITGGWSILCFIEVYSKGHIRGIHFGEDDGEEHAPASADLLNPAAVQRFIELTHDRYYQKLDSYFGTTVQAFFTDEPDILGRGTSRELRPWTSGFLKWYVNHGNHELDLPLLWFDGGRETEIIRKNYQKAVNKRLSFSYYGPLAEWCEQHNISLTGHPAESDDIGLLEHFQIPGQDVVWRWVAPEEGKSLEGHHSTAGKCSADAARHRGRRRNLNEVLGVCSVGSDWNLPAGDMKWYFDWLFVRGVNLISPHAFYYSLEGKRRSHERPPDVGPNNSWWPFYQQFSDYIKRLSWLMTDSVNETSVAILCEEDYLPWKIAKPLYENQIEFNYLEESLLTHCQVENGEINIQKQSYQTILVEDISRLEEECQNFLTTFTQSGGNVIVLQAEKKGTINGALIAKSVEAIPKVLDKLQRREIEIEPKCRDIRISHVKKGNQSFYLLVNEGESGFKGNVMFPQHGSIEKWDSWNGTIDKVPSEIHEGYTCIAMNLDRRESIIFCVNVNEKTIVPKEKVSSSLEIKTLRDPWTVQIKGKKRNVSKLTSWTKWEGYEHYSGTFIYEHRITHACLNATKVLLDLGEVYEIVQVWINEQEVAVKMWAPYTFDITDALKVGENTLKVAVTNTKANQMDQVSLPSGLIGPVTLTISS